MVLDLDGNEREITIQADGEFGPVHKDMVLTDDSQRVFISDIYGRLHCLDLATMTVNSLQVSCHPLSTAITLDNYNVVVGSYDGRLCCIRYDNNFETIWERDCQSSIYAKPLKLQDGGHVVVCTTAGDVLLVSTSAGDIKTLYRIPAEIWSSPVQVGAMKNSVVAFGARDSKCHLIRMGLAS
jgi:outer membrane protein assembly factor BamB